MYVLTEYGDLWWVEADDIKMSRGVSHQDGEDADYDIEHDTLLTSAS